MKDLPAQYVAYRERLLKLAYKFANLNEATREKYADAKSRYRCAGIFLNKDATYEPIDDLVSVGRMARYLTTMLRQSSPLNRFLFEGNYERKAWCV